MFGFFGSVATLVIVKIVRDSLPKSINAYIIQSGSMSPAYPVGSVVMTKPGDGFVSPIPFANYDIGDVISYKQGNSIVTHRIIEVNQKGVEFSYQTRGDANKLADSNLVEESKIIGEVVMVVPYIGKIFAFAKQPTGFITLVLIPSLYIMVSEVMVVISEIKKSRLGVLSLTPTT